MLCRSCRKKSDKRQQAFYDRDPEASKKAHDTYVAKEKHKKSGAYIKSGVYGGLDGIITTFAVVAGVAGAGLNVSVILVLGISNLIADGISMGIGDYLSSKADIDYRKQERKRELWECENYLEGEKAEMVELYIKRGMTPEDATQVIDILARNKQHFVDVMMVEELGLLPVDPDDNPMKEGLVTFVSFVIFGIIPILSYIIGAFITGVQNIAAGFDTPFIVAVVLTAATLFTLGAITSKFTTQEWWQSGLFVLLNGGVAAGAAYGIGALFQMIINAASTEVTFPATVRSPLF
jgi:VIT1/CCC1 family predicted Fe2+/Mn2+ transporter